MVADCASTGRSRAARVTGLGRRAFASLPFENAVLLTFR